MKKLGALLSIILALLTIYWLSPLSAAAATLVTLLSILFVTTILATIGLIQEHKNDQEHDDDGEYLGDSTDDRIWDKLRELSKLLFRKAKKPRE